ncbi:MAG TPA: DUF523 domain-containing protein [Geopsychrobacteraceae bacterium]|nr:DUF523 domain-containing protein [Geopsychrobacteraceae bacterium]
MSETVLVSACLLGLKTRYDGEHNLSRTTLDHLQACGLTVIPICPEQLAGLPTPRCKTWFTEGDGQTVIAGAGMMTDETGAEMMEYFLSGARSCLQIALLNKSEKAILKQNSPSCGTKTVYRSGKKVSGMGVTAALLQEHGIKVFSEDDFSSG